MDKNFTPFWSWINERHAIYLRKKFLESEDNPELEGLTEEEADALASYDTSLLNPPDVSMGELTTDPILKEYRFCNVFRELDRTTVWIRKNIREPFIDNPNLWFMLCIARTINWPETLQELIENAWPLDEAFSPKMMTRVLEKRKKRGDKVYTGAYMIRAESDKAAKWYNWSKQRYISEIALGKLWRHRLEFQLQLSRNDVRLQDIWEMLQEHTGWGPFMAFQAVLDMRHTPLLEKAADRATWAAIGPGSKRGLNRLFGRALKAPLTQEQALEEMWELCIISRGRTAPHVPEMALEDIQNSLCETDKYLRVKNGEGRPRAKFVIGRGY